MEKTDTSTVVTVPESYKDACERMGDDGRTAALMVWADLHGTGAFRQLVFLADLQHVTPGEAIRRALVQAEAAAYTALAIAGMDDYARMKADMLNKAIEGDSTTH